MLTEKTEALRATVEPQEEKGVRVFAGLRTSEGIIVPSADARNKPDEPATVTLPSAAPTEPTAEVTAPQQETLVTVTFQHTVAGTKFNVPGFYIRVYKGQGCVVLTLKEDMSYVPKKFEPGDALFGLDIVPDKQFAYTGMSFRDKEGNNNIILMEG